VVTALTVIAVPPFPVRNVRAVSTPYIVIFLVVMVTLAG